MALEGIDYDTTIQDIIWDDASSGPKLETLAPKVCRDLVEILWVRTDFTRLVGQVNINVLVRTQVFVDQSRSILINQQATQTGLVPPELCRYRGVSRWNSGTAPRPT